MSSESQRREFPTPERICELALKLTAGQNPSPSDGSTKNFADHRISVTTSPSRRPNITVEIFQDRNSPVTVFTAHDNEPGYPTRYNPGRWTKYLHQLVQQNTAPEDERFMTIDDSELFPD